MYGVGESVVLSPFIFSFVIVTVVVHAKRVFSLFYPSLSVLSLISVFYFV